MSASSISASPAGVSLSRALSPLPSLEHEEHGLGSDSLAPLSHLESHGGVELTISLSYSPKVPVGRLGSDGSLDDSVGPALSLSPAVASVSAGHGPDNFSLTRTYASPPFSAMAAASNSLSVPLPQDPSEWTVANVLQYISSLGLGHLKDKFEQNGVDGEQLLDLTYSDLQEDLEVEAEDEINKLLTAIAGLHKFVKRDENGNRLTGTGETPTITPRHASTASHDDETKTGLDSFHAPYPLTLSSPTLLGVPGPEESLLDHHHSSSALSSSIGHSSMSSMTVGLAATSTRAMSLSDAALTVPPDTYSSAVSSTYSHSHPATNAYYAPCTLCVCSCSSCVSTSTMGPTYGYSSSVYHPPSSAVGHHPDHSVSLSISDTKRKRDPTADSNVGMPALSRKKSRQFTWFASVESCVVEHERYCDNYIRGSTQHGVEPGICCRDLVSHASYLMHLVPDSNDCCGVSDSITLTNALTGGVVGSLPCSMTAIFAPLLRHHYIVLSGRIDNLVHPSVGVPPFELRIEADVPGLMAVKKDPRWSGLVQRLRSFLSGWNSDWIPPSYPPNVEELKDMLS